MAYVNREEFACPCCQENWVSEELVEKFNRGRKRSGIPWAINSGCRCTQHNEAVGGRKSSAHTFGLAGDVEAKTSRQKFKIVEAMIHEGITRIGIYSNFVHGDIDKSKPQEVIWHG